MSLDGLSFSALVYELDTKLSGGRIEKIFQPDKYTVLLWVRQSNTTQKLIISVNPLQPHIHLTEAPPENPASPPSFCMLLRKHLEDGRIASITQHDLDRIIKIHVDLRGEKGLIITKCLIIELMGKHSNIIFTQDSIILEAIKRIPLSVSRYRQILPGKVYTLPPGQERQNIFNINSDDFLQMVFSSLRAPTLTKAFISVGMGLGPTTINEVLGRAGLSSDVSLSSLDQKDKIELASALAGIKQAFLSKELVPTVVTDRENRLIAIAAFPLYHLFGLDGFTHHSFDTMSEAIGFTIGLSPVIHHTPDQILLSKLVSEEITRLVRKHTVLSEELAYSFQANLYKEYADNIMANLNTVPPSSNSICLPNLYSETLDIISIDLNPRLSPAANAQAYYHKYAKQKRAQELIRVQLNNCLEEQQYLDTILISLHQAETNSEIQEIRQELYMAGYIQQKRKQHSLPQSTPIYISTEDGFQIIVGKNNRQNDYVTFKEAGPDDLWFHTKDIPGSHVILRNNGHKPSNSAIELAVHFAAYFSKSRLSTNVPVDFTKRRNVKKPSGAKPGFVIYDRQQTIYITPDESLVKKFLNHL